MSESGARELKDIAGARDVGVVRVGASDGVRGGVRDVIDLAHLLGVTSKQSEQHE